MIELTNPRWMFAQVFLAIIVVIIIYILTLNVLSTDALIAVPTYKVKPREEVVIVANKPMTSGALANSRFNTVFPYTKGKGKAGTGAFARTPQSVNGTTGNQFTYQFWMKVNDVNADFKDQVIMLKGENKLYRIGYYDTKTLKHLPDRTEGPKHMIKCPLIKFKDNYKNLVVEFNTNNHPDVQVEINMDSTNDDVKRRNLLSLLPLDWFLFTFVFEENYAITEGAENGIRFTFYVNDIPVQTNNGNTDDILRNNLLKLNDGDLFILPGFSASEALEIKNLKYFNYARSDGEVRSDFESGARSMSDSERSQRVYTAF